MNMEIRKSQRMNSRSILAITAIFAMTLVSCGEKKGQQESSAMPENEIEQATDGQAEMADASFTDGMAGNAFDTYQQIRLALIQSDAGAVKQAAGNLADNMAEEQGDIKSIAMAMKDAADIEEQRQLFSQVTEKVEPLFRESLEKGAIYKQFCPMAFDGKGGYWLSDAEEIRNPYFGDKMLKCGKVTETIAN